jgi:prepilin signal peptidase PulO-like enzyme (type II secretory pathway)
MGDATFDFLIVPGPVIGGAIAGLAWGLVADRIAARWPAHEDGRIRPVDWRTPVVALAGAAAGALVIDRFGAASISQATIMLVEVLALVLLFATDLDQRLLPDVITWPLVGLALIAFALGAGPYVHDVNELAFAAIGAVVAPVVLYLVSIPFGPGAIGQGDLKLLVSVGLLGGPVRLFLGLVSGAIVAAFAIVGLIVLRRITLKTFVPYGPFLIAGAIWALLGLLET